MSEEEQILLMAVDNIMKLLIKKNAEIASLKLQLASISENAQ